MQQNEIVASGLHICDLTQDEINHPMTVLKPFIEDFSLSAIKKMVTTMSDICLTTENVFYGNNDTREDLLYVRRHMLRFFEAAYLFLKREQEHDRKLVACDFREKEVLAACRKLRVCQKTVYRDKGKRVDCYPNLILSGHHLTEAGFNPGDEVAITPKHHKLLITLLRQWDAGNSDFTRRA